MAEVHVSDEIKAPTARLTPGQALRVLDVEDIPNPKSWDDLSLDCRLTYDRRALDALALADRIRKAMA